MATAEYQREWRKKNPDKSREHNRTQRRNHPDIVALCKLNWAKNNPDKVKAAYRKYKYGITPEEFQEKVIAQENKCAICRKDFISVPRVDHNHKTGRVRDLLCQFCNIALSLVEDPIRLKSAIEYLRKHNGK